MPADLFGYLGGVLASLIWVPQLIKAFQRRTDPDRLAGVSLGMWLAQGTANGLWLIYGIRIAAAPQIVGNLVALAGAATMVEFIRRDRHSPVGRLLPATAVLWVGGTVTAPIVTGFAGALSTAIARLAQIVSSLRRGTQRSGVALGTWLLSITAMTCWLTYGALLHDWPVVTVNIIGIALNGAVITIEIVTRHRDPTAHLHPAAPVPANRVDTLGPPPSPMPASDATGSTPPPAADHIPRVAR